MHESAVELEMRLFALETIVCQNLATAYQMLPPQIFEATKTQALSAAEIHAFKGADDPAISDLLASEFHAALERLYKMIQSHLDKARTRGAE